MTSAQVVETSLSHQQHSELPHHPDDHTIQITKTPKRNGFDTFKSLHSTNWNVLFFGIFGDFTSMFSGGLKNGKITIMWQQLFEV